MVSKRNLRGTEPLGYLKPLDLPNCPLCGRPMLAGARVDVHRLLPKSCGGKVKEPVHRICHRKIHATLSERELGKGFSSWAALQQHPEIAVFMKWVATKPATFYDNSRKPARRR